MTADGTYPVTRTGEIRTASELDALPDGSVVKDIDAVLGSRTIGSTKSGWMLAGFEVIVSSEFVIEQAESALTVLFRPDAPQSATVGDDAVERAARAYHDKVCSETEDATPWEDESEAYREDMRDDVRCILAAARAGEAEPEWRAQVLAWADEAPEGTAGLDLLRQIVGIAPARRGGEAVDREALIEAAFGIIGRDEPMSYITRSDIAKWVDLLGPLLSGATDDLRKQLDAAHAQIAARDREIDQAWTDLTDAVLAARGDTVPTEVEWGVRFGPATEPVVAFDEDGSALDEEAARAEVGETPGATLMQRDVHRSAWREVR